jgi:DNA-binding transcriptional LysR family regulator
MKPSVAGFETLVSDVRDLRAFALTCDLKSLTAAARLLGESKATISRRITRLETDLGTALLRRSPRAVEPTDAGADYRSRVGEVLELLSEANAMARGAQAVPSGQLRVTAPPGLGELLGPVLAQFAVAFPKVAVSVHVASRYVDLEAEQFDVALRAARKLADSSLVAHRLGSGELEHVVVASPAYLKAHATPRRVEDLLSHRVLRAQEATVPTPIAFRQPASGTTVKVNVPIAMTSTDIVLIKDIVLEGAGVSILPRILVQRYLDDGRLVHLLPSVVAPGLNLYLVHRGGRLLPPKIKAFCGFVKQHLFGAPSKVRRAKARR